MRIERAGKPIEVKRENGVQRGNTWKIDGMVKNTDNAHTEKNRK